MADGGQEDGPAAAAATEDMVQMEALPELAEGAYEGVPEQLE